MKPSVRNLLSVILIGTMAGIAGCRQTRDDDNVSAADKVYAKATNALESGHKEHAIALIKKALNSRKLNNDDKVTLFPRFIGILLSIDEAGKAEEEYLQAISGNPDCARAAFTRIPDYYSGAQNTDALIAWYSAMVKSGLPDDLKNHSLDGLVSTLYATGQPDAALDKIKENLPLFAEGACDDIMHNLLYQAMDGDRPDDAGQILTAVRTLRPDNASVKQMCDTAEINIAAIKGDWSETLSLFKAASTSLNDDAIDSLLRRLIKIAAKQEKTNELDAVLEHVLTGMTGVEKSKKTAANRWISNAGENSAEIITRLETLPATGISINDQFRLMANNFYKVIQSENRDCMLRVYVLSEKLGAQLTDEPSRKRLILLQLDATFMLQDYGKTLALMEKGIPDMDETWHKSATAKLKAHIAMESGHYADAIKYFSEFMTYAAAQEKPEFDPLTGVKHTREMILGRNMKRIGDIYKLMSDTQKATESYGKAMEYYTIAIGETSNDTASATLVAGEVADLQKSLKSASETPGD